RHTRSLRDWSSDVCSSDLHVSLRAQLLIFRVSTPKISSWARSDTCAALRLAHLAQREDALRLERHRLPAVRHRDVAVELVVELRSEERRVGKECRCRGERL